MRFCFEFLKFIEGDEFSVQNHREGSKYSSKGARAMRLKTIREKFLRYYRNHIIAPLKKLAI